MEKKENVKKYELVVILDAKAGNDAKEAITKETVEVINQAGGKVINSKVWLEKHRLTFPIKKCQDGTYYVVQFEAAGKQVQSIRGTLRLKEKILRFLVVESE
jgi:small subunit ribosomal protein S6